jgi:5-methylcytosine-specific restriction endonuclease McrA
MWYNACIQTNEIAGRFCSIAAFHKLDTCGQNALCDWTYVLAVRLDNGGNCGGRFAMSARSLTYKKHWLSLVSYYGPLCFYCHKEIATTIDHVVPYSYDQDNGIENLVPACTLCNALASDKMFESVEHKRQFILEQRQKRANQIVVCSECLLPFAYRTHSPSLFLCAECYDEEYDAKYSRTKEWSRWIEQLYAAGIPADAHRSMKKKLTGWRKGRSRKIELLIDEYSSIIGTDEKFAETLISI